MNYQQWRDVAVEQLAGLRDNDPYLNAKNDANALLQFVTGKSRAFILAFPETALNEAELNQLQQFMLLRLQGQPIAYILGEKAFWSLSLKVSADTLIPRPDTEILVEKACALIAQDLAQSAVAPYRILDLGTGTGAIALALAKEFGAAVQVVGVDKIAQAVALAQENQWLNQITNVEFLQSDWFSALDEQTKFNMIVSNPPYIDAQDPHLSRGDVRFEPRSALVAENEGYADLQHIIRTAECYLKPNGWLLLEHGWQQSQKMRSLFQKYHWQAIETVKDYGDNERVTLAHFPQ